ncbi:MAG: aminotransferase class V-fold PLP-dependent enzyme, partial [Anaerolineaceae bacterium]|nr:aminotransferase class V-fold PLP-dependent enzyme [Anaerolineaceae bacterium]
HHYIDPLVVSWGWDNPTITTNPLVDYIEWMGTRDISAFLSVSAAIDYQKINHWDEFREKCHQLAAYTQIELSTLLGIKPYHPNSADWFMQMAALELPGVTDPLKLKTTLYEKYKIEVPIIEWNGRVLIRFSFQAYNDQNDADALISALKSELTKS